MRVDFDKVQSAKPTSDELTSLIAQEKTPRFQIQCPKILDSPHEWVEATLEAYANAKEGEEGVLKPKRSPPLKLDVTRATFDRAILIFDSLLKAFELRNLEVKKGPSVRVLEFWMSVEINEQRTRFERARKFKDEFEALFYSPTEVYYERNGKLSLSIDCGYLGDEFVRRQFRDTDKQSVEALLNRFMVSVYRVGFGLRAAAVALEERRRELAVAEANRKANELEAPQRRAEKRDEEKRVERLLQEVSEWKQCESIREYVRAVQIASSASGTKSIDDWAQWALAIADRSDPTRRHLQRVQNDISQ